MTILVARRTGVLLLALALAIALLVAPPAKAEDADTLRTANVSAASELRTRDLDAACPTSRVPSSDFRDIGQPFTRAIECLVWYDITRGRTATTYGTNDGVTRGQMALFLHRTLKYNFDVDALPGEDTGHAFSDVPTSGEVGRALNTLASDELAEYLDLDAPLVRGFDDGTYRPGNGVERAQMASFMARALDGLLVAYDGSITPGSCTFADSQAIPPAHRSSVNTVCSIGIAEGRADGTFAPRNRVTRGQMAAFLMRTQDVAADEPFYATLPDQNIEYVDNEACGGSPDGSENAPWCTIQQGVDAASGTYDRVRVAGSDTEYSGDVDLGGSGAEIIGYPVEDEDGDVLRTHLVGSIGGDAAGNRVVIARMIVWGSEGAAGVDISNAAQAGISSVAVRSAVAGTSLGTGIAVDADYARIDAADVGNATVALSVNAASGDVRSSFFGSGADAYLVDVADGLDLEEILERVEFGVTNNFPSDAEVGQYQNSPAIVPGG